MPEEILKINPEQGPGQNKKETKEKTLLVLTKQQKKLLEKLLEGMELSNEESSYQRSESFEEILQSPEVQAAAKEGMIKELDNGWLDSVRKIQKTFNLPEEFVQETAKRGMLEKLSFGEIDAALEIQKTFNLPEEFVQSPEVQAAAKEGMVMKLNMGWIDDALKIQKTFNLPEEFVQETAKRGMIKNLSFGNIDDALEIQKTFNLPEEIVQSPEVQAAAKQGMIRELNRGWIDDALEIQKTFNLPEEFVQETAKRGMIENLSFGNIDTALEIQKTFNLPEEIVQSPEVQAAAKERMIRELNRGWIDTALKIQKAFNLPEEFVRGAAKEILKNLFSREDSPDKLLELQEYVKLSFPEIIEILPQEIKDILENLKKRSPQFFSQAQRAPEIIFELVSFRSSPERLFKTIDDNPFLIEALTQNPRFAPKLLLSFLQFDKISKEKIKVLFENKKKILSSRPELDPGSLEFRLLMQEKLLSFSSNQEIVKALKESGLQVENWLNYEKTRYFTLLSGEEVVPLSERIQAPVERLSETLGTYIHQVKKVLSAYRPELLEILVLPSEAQETEGEIKKMEEELEKAKEKGEEKKAQGIARGLESLKLKLSSIKKIPLWNFLMNETEGFSKLKGGLAESQENLLNLEKKYQEFLSSKEQRGLEVFKLKNQINQIKEDFRKKFAKFEYRINEFRQNLVSYLSPLKKERAEALVQEIEQNVSQQLVHYQVDCQTLEAFFSEKASTDKEKLEDKPMSIFVWSRNPDLDLYQGNYSPCCISIERTPDSAIADYATDLGVQVVNVYDEVKKEPVLAAWCWLGENEEGETALVIDNIEANTLYTSNFPVEFWQELRSYLTRYAQAVGAKNLVLGKSYNDLPTPSLLNQLPEAGETYTKIAGFNERLDGYYLDAEEESVKKIWSQGEKPEEKLKKPKGEKPKEIEIKEMQDKDFQEIIDLEKEIYSEELQEGWGLINDLKKGNGLKYSFVLNGRFKDKAPEFLGYALAYEDETDEGDACLYLNDLVLKKEAQGFGLGWQLLQEVIKKIKAEAKEKNQPLLFDMHLMPDSQRLFERHEDDLKMMGVSLAESALVPDYYDEGEDALYCVYEIKP